MNGTFRLIMFFGLGMVVQALLLIRDNWEWKGFLYSLGFSLLGLMPGKNEHHYSIYFHLLLCFVTFACFIAINFRKALLPRVSEKILLAYCVTLWYAFFALLYSPGWLSYAIAGLLLVPTLGTAVLAFTESQLSFKLKLFFYAWYLVMVVLMVCFQFSFTYLSVFFSGTEAAGGTALGAVLSGMGFCYMVVNVTYLYHMMPIRGKHESQEECLLRWHGWTDLMTGRYCDAAQLTHIQALLIVAALGGFYAANIRYGFISAPNAVNFGILIPLLLMPGDATAIVNRQPSPGLQKEVQE